MNLWPRLAIPVTLGFVALFGIFSLLAMRAVNASTERILDERLVIGRMAAAETDRLFKRSAAELKRASELGRFDPQAPSLSAEQHVLADTRGRVGALSLGISLLDAGGRVVLSEPPGELANGRTPSWAQNIAEVVQTRQWSLSAPFVDPATGRPAVALTFPILDSDGSVRSMLSEVLDMSSPDVLAPLAHAKDLGNAGHAVLVAEGGLVIASTDGQTFLQPGEHFDYYVRMLQAHASGVENVPEDVSSGPESAGAAHETGAHHVMAFAPLSVAPWGIAVGGSASETFAPVARLRRTLLLTGALSLALLWALTLVGARLLVRPVRTLTGAARGMASGDLDHPIGVREGGEIGILGESLDAMRTQLKKSLETVRRWGEELETRVEERTAELRSRNRQLASMTAVATAANGVRNLDGMLGRCLEVILEHTGMEAAAVRLLDEEPDRLSAPVSRGAGAGFPCHEGPIGTAECACGLTASTGDPLFVDAGELDHELPLRCRAPRTHALAVLPLQSPRGTLGVLCLARKSGEAPGPDERETLAAISNQIGVAVENARLLEELSRLDAQREMQRLKAELISAVSHELRTPLGVIKGYVTSLLRDDIAAIDPETEREFLETIDEETGVLQHMIDELLDASRLQAGRLHVEAKQVPLGELVESAVSKVRGTLAQTGHTVELRLPHQDVQVSADPMRVEQVLRNLLGNASRYSEPNTPIEVTVGENGDGIVSVADQGDGIPEAEQELVFESFYRGENARRRAVRGAGLGLAISRAMIETMGGRIWVESSPKRGSTFRFSLPAAEDREAVR